MTFLEELKWRGMLFDHTPNVADQLTPGARAYTGFDPTAPSITIGNYVQVMLLLLFKKHGHQPIALLGGATGRIGDPSGKDEERTLKSFDELDNNTEAQVKQIKEMLNAVEGEEPIIVNNLDFYKDMNALDFLRDIGKTLTVNYMIQKDSVKNRIEKGISFTEFSYQLLQAYDFQSLYQLHNCHIQMGGSDQWGNITSGTEFIRKNLNAKAHGITTPLLTKKDGSKFGKSTSGNVWMDRTMTSPYSFYQFWINSDDADMESYLKYFSLKSLDEIQSLIDQLETDPGAVKRTFAEEFCTRIHGQEAFDSCQKVSKLLFAKKLDKEILNTMPIDVFDMLANEISHANLDKNKVNEISISDLLVDSGFLQSKGDVRRAIKGNALAVNKSKVQDHDLIISDSDLLQGSYIFIENGKKNKFLISVK